MFQRQPITMFQRQPITMTWAGVAGLLVLLIHVPATNGCNLTQQRMACQLFESNNVIAARRHPSGQTDDAYAYNNLRDMCWGGEASRSSYQCDDGHHAPDGTVCLSNNLLRYLVHLQNSGRVVINELAGACHSRSSRHYSGLAVDLHKDSRQTEYVEQCGQHGGWALSERNHVHCQFYDGAHRRWGRV